jgi:RNA polymerase sigma-70 factor, ECF subfamily
MEASAPHAPPTFEELMLPHMDAAYNLARWLLRDPHDAEDALQDACLRAYRSLDRFRGDDGRAWLLTIVRNVCYSRMRQRRREPAKDAFDDDAHGSTHDPADANAAAWRETKGELLQQALERLPDEYREVIVLHEIEGLPYRDIAVVAGIPIGTVMSRLARARSKLQTELIILSGKAPSHDL